MPEVLTQDQYRTDDRATLCPQCQEQKYDVMATTVWETQVVQRRECRVCDLHWSAVFRIAGYVRDGHEDEDWDSLFAVACVDESPSVATTPSASSPEEDVPTDDQYREWAREEYQEDGAVEIDDNAVISRGDDPGAYVAAWVWVSDRLAPEED